MRILHLNDSDIMGGAARAATRLHQALKSHGVDSRMLVAWKHGDDATVQVTSGGASMALASLRMYLNVLPTKMHPRRRPGLFTTAYVPDGLARLIAQIAPDVVHCHWLGNGFFRLETLGRIQLPIVWTLHDEWAFTGGCHYLDGCTRYVERCGRCPALGSRHDRDMSRWVWRRKRAAFRNACLTFVAPSRWIAESAARSSLLAGRRIEVVPNPIDVETYRPIDRRLARRMLRLPEDKQYVLFSAVGGSRPERKGFAKLAEALHRLHAQDPSRRIELLMAGVSDEPRAASCGVPVRCLGMLSDDVAVVLANSAADVVAVPSLQENLANTVVEALACGRPVVAFRIGGMPEMITDRENGVLVEPYDTTMLAEAFAWTLSDVERWDRLSSAARQKAHACYSEPVVARSLAAIYEEARAGAVNVCPTGARRTPVARPRSTGTSAPGRTGSI